MFEGAARCAEVTNGWWNCGFYSLLFITECVVLENNAVNWNFCIDDSIHKDQDVLFVRGLVYGEWFWLLVAAVVVWQEWNQP